MQIAFHSLGDLGWLVRVARVVRGIIAGSSEDNFTPHQHIWHRLVEGSRLHLQRGCAGKAVRQEESGSDTRCRWSRGSGPWPVAACRCRARSGNSAAVRLARQGVGVRCARGWSRSESGAHSVSPRACIALARKLPDDGLRSRSGDYESTKAPDRRRTCR